MRIRQKIKFAGGNMSQRSSEYIGFNEPLISKYIRARISNNSSAKQIVVKLLNMPEC
jgi:hypothetical protein